MSVKIKGKELLTVGPMCKMLNVEGKVGIIIDKNSSYHGDVVIRVYNLMVSLTNPRNTWSNIEDVSILVELQPAGTVVEYTSEV